MINDVFKKPLSKTGKANQRLKGPEVPEGMWRKCRFCGSVVYAGDVKKNYYTCPKCGGFFRVHGKRRIEMIADSGSFEEWDQHMPLSDPLDFPGYKDKLQETKDHFRIEEAVITGRVNIGSMPCAMAVCDNRFLMASMGHVVGEKITRTIERAAEEKIPVIIYASSGGARMQEGIISLMQMAKTSAALYKLHEAGQLYICVLTDPTTGGVTASFAMLGDIILAEPRALIGFAGPRVIAQTIGVKLPEGFQRSEFLLEHGFIDMIVERKDQRNTLMKLLRLHRASESDYRYSKKNSENYNTDVSGKDNETDETIQGGGETPQSIEETVQSGDGTICSSDNTKKNADPFDIRALTSASEIKKQDNGSDKKYSAWDTVTFARKNDRPVAKDYIDLLFSDFIELHGDRLAGDDGAIVGGLAVFHGIPVTVIAQQKGRNLKENKIRNFGMPAPEGYRKAVRLMKQAERFNRPVICIVDTPGAFCGIEAEERGQGEAIARSIYEMSGLKVPVLSVVIGEGGSGGALALAMSNEVWMLQFSMYSILSPEGFASILYKDAKRAKEAAIQMKLTAAELMQMGIIDRIIPESEDMKKPVSKDDMSLVIRCMDKEIEEFLERYKNCDGEELKEQRYERFRKF